MGVGLEYYCFLGSNALVIVKRVFYLIWLGFIG